MPSLAKITCDTCNKLLPKVKMACSCKTYKFCDNTCYSLRPMRQSHREECERKTKEKEDLIAAQEKAVRARTKSHHAKEQDRDARGQFAKTKKKLRPEEKKKKERNNLHSRTSKIKRKLIKYSKKLDMLRKPWSICVLVQKTEVRARSNPVLYKSKNFVTNGPPVNRQNVSEEPILQEAPREIDLSVNDHDEDELMNRPRRPNYRCYICNQRTGPLKGFVCSSTEGGEKCTNGAACRSCINLDSTSLTKAEMRKFKSNWRCPLHKRKPSAESSDDSGNEADPENVETGAELKKKSRKVPNYRISADLRLILPEEMRLQDIFTRSDLVKGVHLYIKENPGLKVRDETNKNKFMIHPDETLAKVYGTQAFEALSGVQKFGDHAELIKNVDDTRAVRASTPNVTDSGPSSPPSDGPSTSSSLSELSPSQRDDVRESDTSSDDSDSDSTPEKLTRSPKKFLKNPQRHLTTKSPPRLPRPPKNSKMSLSPKTSGHSSPMSLSPASSVDNSPSKIIPLSPKMSSPFNAPDNSSTMSPSPKNSVHSSPKSLSAISADNSSLKIIPLSPKTSSASKQSSLSKNSAPPKMRQENCVNCDAALDYDAMGEDQVERCKACYKFTHKKCHAESCENCVKLLGLLSRDKWGSS